MGCAVQGSDSAHRRQAGGRGVTTRIARAKGKARPPEIFAKPDRTRVFGFLQGYELLNLLNDFGKIL